jgi:Arc/MetJ-type ribon-helix-helix transcriptional regulator
MATMTIKSTYSLDPATVRAIENLARRFGVSRSEALRRAVKLAAGHDAGALAALEELQGAAGLDKASATRWAVRARRERRTSSTRREASVR